MNPLVRTLIDEWSTKEKLILASSVLAAGDQNWYSVSRQCKPFGEPKRPADWFGQKNCALQYSVLLDNQETPKRKRGEKNEDTSQKLIERKLRNERIEELRLKIEKDKVELDHLKKNISLLKNDNLSETDLKIIHNQVKEVLKQAKKDEEKYKLWLKERAEKYELLNSRKKSIGILKTPKKDDSLSGLSSLPSTPIKTPTTPLVNLSSTLSNQQQQDSQSTEKSNKDQPTVDEKQKLIKQENLIQLNQDELNKTKDKQQTTKDDKVQIILINETEKQTSDKSIDLTKEADKQTEDNQLNDKNKIEITVVQPQVIKMEICESTKNKEDINKETTIEKQQDESKEQSESVTNNKRKRTSSSVSSQSNTPIATVAQQTPTQTRRSGRIKPTTRTSLNQSVTATPKSQDTSIIEHQPKKITIEESVTIQKHTNQPILNDESTKDSTTSDLTDTYTSPNSPASSILNVDSSDPEQLKEYKTWKKAILQLWRQAQTHKFSSLFLSPVTDDEAKDYSSVVLKPIDLTMIKKKIENGTIRTTQGIPT